jgi:hypothetical protein
MLRLATHHSQTIAESTSRELNPPQGSAACMSLLPSLLGSMPPHGSWRLGHRLLLRRSYRRAEKDFPPACSV